MSTNLDVDVLVIGAGPAGVCAALRLLQLGYRTALVERSALPRPNIGESLTPGVRSILELLDASAAIRAVPFLSDLPTRLLWDSREPELLLPQASTTGCMTDRGAFDYALFKLVAARGGQCLAPAEVRAVNGNKGAWRVTIKDPQQQLTVQARLIMDARGRSVGAGTQRLPTAPPLVAIWAELVKRTSQDLPAETLVEALPDGWLWGSPLPGGGYRVMSFCDPVTLRKSAYNKPARWLKNSLWQSRLFRALAEREFIAPPLACSSRPYLDEAAWRPGHLKLGDAAFAIDPLSSSGVEKAMRFSLQAVVTAHTMLSDPAAEALAQDFFAERLLDCVARHSMWTQRYYGQAWPADQPGFWQDRAREFIARKSADSPVEEKLRQAIARLTATTQPGRSAASDVTNPVRVAAMWQGAVSLSPALTFVELPCIIADRIELRQAIVHPNLERPIAYVEGEQLAVLLRIVPLVGSLATAVELWASRMPLTTARRIAGWLCQKGLVQSATR